MLSRPSNRKKRKIQTVWVNLVPMLDALVTLIAFLLYTLSFMSIVGIESPTPIASPQDMEKKLKEKPLQLTVSIDPKQMEIWSPFNRIETKKIENTPDGKPDLSALHRSMIEIKQNFPLETKVILVPYLGLNYDVLVGVIDAVRFLEPADPVCYIKNEATGINQEDDRLFPEIIFGNLLGG